VLCPAAAYLSGNGDDNSECEPCVTNLLSMIVEKLISSNGGTSQSLVDGSMEVTSSTAACLVDFLPAERKELAEAVVARRIRAKDDFGLDMSAMSHQLLALAARWHLTATKRRGGEAGDLPSWRCWPRMTTVT